MKSFNIPLLAGFILALIIFLLPLLFNGTRDLGTLANIHGQPYPLLSNRILVTEKIAHADVYLQEPVWAKKLILDITFSPGQTQNLSLGIRQQSFWLGYQPVTFYATTNSAAPSRSPLSARVVIPLTDKFQETDRSLDLMFFADYEPAAPDYDLANNDPTNWQIHSLTARTAPAWPSFWHTLDYLAALLLRERAA